MNRTVRRFTASVVFMAIACLSQAVNADISVSFREGAPKDRFTITNSGVCEYEKLRLRIDLTDSVGKLIFDTTQQGEGVEVFQPFETADSGLSLVGATSVKDGQKLLDIAIETLGPNKSLSFTIDVDDTLTNSELGNIRVSRSEIAGGTVQLSLENNEAYQSVFGTDTVAVLSVPAC